LGWGALLGAALLLLAQSCSTRTHGQDEVASAVSLLPTLELWVDVQGPEGGDGSPARPLRRLESALRAPAQRRLVHLAPGVYAGPFRLEDGTELVGGSAAVLTAPADVPVLEAHGSVRLVRLLVQGGALGVLASGRLELQAVRFSGQRKGAVLLAEAGTLRAEAVLFEASVSGGVGLLLQQGAMAELEGCTFEGPWQRAIDAATPARLRVTKSSFRGAVTALQQKGGAAELADVTVAEGRGPGLYVAAGTLVLTRVSVTGQEYALLTGTGAVVEARDFTSRRADRAGVGVVKARAHFQGLTITEAGSFGGLQLISSEVQVQGLRVEDAQGTGVSLRGGKLELTDGVVLRSRDADGSAADGVQLRGGQARLQALSVDGATGACLLAAEGAHVLLSQATLQHCHTAGLVAEADAHLQASDVTVLSSDGPGAVATGEGELVLQRFRTLATDGVVWAECAGGAQVTALEVEGALPQLPCVQKPAEQPPVVVP
jgi:hypothetical protein